MSRTLTLSLIGLLAGVLGFAGASMIASEGRDLPGDTASLELALALLGIAGVVALAGVGLGIARFRMLVLIVAAACLVIGVVGLTAIVLASLVAAGMFPDLLLTPSNLTVIALLLLASVSGAAAWRLARQMPWASTGQRGPSDEGWWPPLAVGIALGVVAAWLWSAILIDLIPYECCLL